jgi:metallo-beta-lactamase class B
MWCRDINPSRIFGNLYFVGVHEASTHLIDTGEGLIVIDPGYPECFYVVLNHIWQLGFDPRDIKYIVHSHGHYDHAGATKMLVELTGAKTFIGERDANMVRNLKTRTPCYDVAFEPDVLLHTGDTVTLGNTTMHFVETPGHTDGTVSMFFDVTDGEKTLRAGMHGGVGFNTLSLHGLLMRGRTYHARREFLEGLLRIENEKVDITLGNHVGQNKTELKLKKMKTAETNPFIDPDEWKRFIESYKEKINNLIASENNA